MSKDEIERKVSTVTRTSTPDDLALEIDELKKKIEAAGKGGLTRWAAIIGLVGAIFSVAKGVLDLRDRLFPSADITVVADHSAMTILYEKAKHLVSVDVVAALTNVGQRAAVLPSRSATIYSSRKEVLFRYSAADIEIMLLQQGKVPVLTVVKDVPLTIGVHLVRELVSSLSHGQRGPVARLDPNDSASGSIVRENGSSITINVNPCGEPTEVTFYKPYDKTDVDPISCGKNEVKRVQVTKRRDEI